MPTVTSARRRRWVWALVLASVVVAATAAAYSLAGGTVDAATRGDDLTPPAGDATGPGGSSSPDATVSGVVTTDNERSQDDVGSSGAGADATSAPTGPSTDGDAPEFTHRSAEIEAVSRRPVGLRIDALEIDAQVVAAGRDGDGQLDVPENGSTVVWYRAGSVPGAAGSAVLAAHVDYAGRPGVFFDLDDLVGGDVVHVDFDDGTTAAFEVTEGRRYVKEQLPVGQLFTRSGAPVLTLVTCGGQFNATTRHYDSNTVVRATLR